MNRFNRYWIKIRSFKKTAWVPKCRLLETKHVLNYLVDSFFKELNTCIDIRFISITPDTTILKIDNVKKSAHLYKAVFSCFLYVQSKVLI